MTDTTPKPIQDWAAVVDYHDKIVSDFSRGYGRDGSFRERLSVWSDVIGNRIKSGDHVLDLGCGPGAITVVAARIAASVTAIDASAAMLSELHRRLEEHHLQNVTVRHQSFDDFFKSTTDIYDVILCSSVVEYLDDPDSFIAACSHILKTNGFMLLSIPNAASYYRIFERHLFRITGWPSYYRHVRTILQESDARALLSRHGYGIQPTGTRQYGATPPWWPFKDKTMLLLEGVKQGHLEE